MRLSRIFVSLSAAALAACSPQDNNGTDSTRLPIPVDPTGNAGSAASLSLVNFGNVLNEPGRFSRFEAGPFRVRAHKDFCERNAAECDSSPWQDTYLPVSKTLMELLKVVNADVNRRMIAMHDNSNYGRDFWTVPPEDENGNMRGDCDDYTMTKRSILSKFIPKAAMSVAFVEIHENGVYSQSHAVLVVRTLGGELVLDNLTNELKTPQQTGYKFIAMTEPYDQSQWRRVSLNESNSVKDMSSSYKIALMKDTRFQPPLLEGRHSMDVDVNILKTLANEPRYAAIRQKMALDPPQLLMMMQ